MNLHRSNSKPDWAKRPRKRWNSWQKAAAYTGGTVTIGNAVTAIGFIGVLIGLYLIIRHHYVAGLITIAAGRLCDVLDGWLADLTGTKSPLGEKLDAGFDKLGTALTVIVLVIVGVIPVWATITLALPQLAIGIVAYRALRINSTFHPSKAGKLSMTFVWLAIGGHVLTHLIYNGSQVLNLLTLISGVLTITSALFGLRALLDYMRHPGTI